MRKKITALLAAGILLQPPLTVHAIPSFTYVPSNILNVEIKDRNGIPSEDVMIDMLDENGELVGTFYGSNWFIPQKTTAIIGYMGSDTPDFQIPWEEFTRLIDPWELDEIYRSNGSYASVFKPNSPPTQSAGETRVYELHIYPVNEKPAFTLPAGHIAVSAHRNCLSKPMQLWMDTPAGSICINKDPNELTEGEFAYSGNGEIQIFPKYQEEHSGLLSIGYQDGHSSFYSYNTAPIVSTEDVEYDLQSINIADVFENATADGKIVIDGRTYDMRRDSDERSTLLLIQSGGVVTYAEPFTDGKVYYYTSRKNRSVTMELHYSFEDGIYSGCSSISENLYGGIIDQIEFTIPSMPESGLNLYHVPAGTYTLQYREIPEGYTAPETTQITVKESQTPQFLELVLGGGILYGDVDENGTVNAADAALLLKAASLAGSGGASGLNADQEQSADVDGDGVYNASDAALILQYAAYTGSGGTGSMTDFLG